MSINKLLLLIVLIATPLYTQAAINLDGSTQGMFTTTVNPGNGVITVECWIYFTSVDASRHIFSYNTASDSNFNFYFGTNGGGLFRIGTGGGTNGAHIPLAHTWYYVHADYDGSNANLVVYNVDGSVFDSIVDNEARSGTFSSMSFGYNKGDGPGNFLNGRLRNCLVYKNISLSVAQTKKNMQSPNPLFTGSVAPMAYYPMVDGNDTRNLVSGNQLTPVASPGQAANPSFLNSF